MSESQPEDSFDAVGSECLEWYHPALLLPITGFIQVLPAIYFTIISPSPLLEASLRSKVIGLSALLFILSFIALLILRVLYYRTGPLTVSWVDQRRSSGALFLSYVGPTGRMRHGLQVKKVTPYPGEFLTREGYRGSIPVAGTSSRMVIDFVKPMMYLDLGFPDDQMMNNAYNQLK